MTMLLLQAQEAAAYGAAEAAHGAFHPTLLGWIALLPLLGFLINGFAAVAATRARRPPPPTHAVGEPSEFEHHDVGTEPHPADPAQAQHADDHHDAHPPPAAHSWTHLLPSFVAPGVVGLAFAIALVNFFGMLGAHLEEPV
ncbi:MAG TPA: hypothetical protein VGR27_06900, partial [Longimicrobiaceae bacterium]|nr:hypothetical protein [Longimicrobiaceae bacterium]